MKEFYQDSESKKGFTVGDRPKLKVTIKYLNLESTCEGSADEALRFVFNFIRDVYPDYELISGLTLSVDLEDLLRKIKDIIAFLPRGQAIILKSSEGLTDRDHILTQLVAAYVAGQMGITEKNHLSMAELLEKTGKSAGTVAGRISELLNKMCVERVGRGEYEVTTYGIKEFLEEVLPKLEKGR